MEKDTVVKKLRETLEKLGVKEGRKGLAVYGILLILLVCAYLVYTRAPVEGEAVSTLEEVGLEERLGEAMSKMRGAGQVRVLITYETGEEKVTATVSTTDESISGSGEGTSSSQKRETLQPATLTTGEGQQAIVLYEKEPRIRGVLVVAEGAGDPSVRLNLQRAVMAVTGVSLDRIEVFEMGYGS